MQVFLQCEDFWSLLKLCAVSKRSNLNDKGPRLFLAALRCLYAGKKIKGEKQSNASYDVQEN